MKTIHLEGAMLDEVDVWFPNIPMVVKGVQCGVPGIQKYSPMYPMHPNVSPIYPKFHKRTYNLFRITHIHFPKNVAIAQLCNFLE